MKRQIPNPLAIIRHRDLFPYIYRYYTSRLARKVNHLTKLQITPPPRSQIFDREILDSQKNQVIYDLLTQALENNTPLMLGRYGSAELDAMRSLLFYDRKIISSLFKAYSTLCTNAGFFPKNLTQDSEIYPYLRKFSDLMLEATQNCDVIGTWRGYLGFEDYFLEHFASPNLKFVNLGFFGPNIEAETPFTYALKGQKVLVIHPFEKTIISQYKRREKLFENPKVLPEFELKTLKAVQTMHLQKDERFKDWFEALVYMEERIKGIDFDIALLGCGAYGFPLASIIKNMGKIAIHCGGALQLLFGIKGKRWEIEQPNVGKKLFNEHWVRPSEDEVIKDSAKIEGSCYW